MVRDNMMPKVVWTKRKGRATLIIEKVTYIRVISTYFRRCEFVCSIDESRR